ncbi:putative PhzC/PhzF-type epimerase [Heracleum sosnowskyi]|uniref:PhzC/PhzF-type epimerase n=1 Tax=Heracleum sosnowskyi TaxID=360622 RepID=A0AAD8HV93_9APIA|nr:putative PhzC/PhzF-type epimerase [Heracleum sosnowskyi]
MAKKLVKYCVVDAFTESAFKGNPAAVCLLEEEKDDTWLQAVATEFNISQTCFLTRIASDSVSTNPQFGLRWFTPVVEVQLCGHGTLATSHFLFSSGLVDADVIEFLTLSGILTAKRVPDPKISIGAPFENGNECHGVSVELSFPALTLSDYDSPDKLTDSPSLSSVSTLEIKKTPYDDLFIVLPSGKAVAEYQPQFDEIQKLPGRGLIITGLAPPGSGFDFYSRFFCPKYGINEDPVCGSAHCALAPYWCQKLEKTELVAYQASPRGGTINLYVDEENQRILIRGKSVTVMEGSLLA